MLGHNQPRRRPRPDNSRRRYLLAQGRQLRSMSVPAWVRSSGCGHVKHVEDSRSDVSQIRMADLANDV